MVKKPLEILECQRRERHCSALPVEPLRKPVQGWRLASSLRAESGCSACGSSRASNCESTPHALRLRLLLARSAVSYFGPPVAVRSAVAFGMMRDAGAETTVRAGTSRTTTVFGPMCASSPTRIPPRTLTPGKITTRSPN